jgi:hypothetical protein
LVVLTIRTLLSIGTWRAVSASMMIRRGRTVNGTLRADKLAS